MCPVQLSDSLVKRNNTVCTKTSHWTSECLSIYWFLSLINIIYIESMRIKLPWRHCTGEGWVSFNNPSNHVYYFTTQIVCFNWFLTNIVIKQECLSVEGVPASHTHTHTPNTHHTHKSQKHLSQKKVFFPFDLDATWTLINLDLQMVLTFWGSVSGIHSIQK